MGLGWGCVEAITHSISALSHHPTRRFGLDFFFFFFSTSSSPLGGFQRLSEGDSTNEERKGEREIKTKQNESKSCSKLRNSFHRPSVSEKAHKFGLRSRMCQLLRANTSSSRPGPVKPGMVFERALKRGENPSAPPPPIPRA